MKLIEQIAIERIKQECNTKNYEFLGFVGGKLEYNTTKLILKCNVCGNIWKTTSYSNFINKHQGCPNCKKERLRKLKTINTFEAENKVKEKCNKKNVEFIGWDNEKNQYKGYKSKLILKCLKCNNVWNTTTYDHFVNENVSCPQCAKEVVSNKLSSKLNDVIEKANIIHNNSYDYSLVKTYKNNLTKYDIICKKHGIFTMDFTHHIDRKQGCPYCNQSKLETEIKKMLDDNGYNYIYKARKRTIPWIQNLELDFYLKDYNIAIECQGIQHFEQVEHFGGEEEFEKLKKRDKLKMDLCIKNNTKLLYYSSDKYGTLYQTFKTTKEILEEIKKSII